MSSELTNSQTGATVGSVVRVASGNFLEMYDLMVYAYYASYIAKDIFPSSNPFASLMLTLGTFGAGYLMRRRGAIILGAYIDQNGRRAGLILALSLMAVGTFTIACTPGYRVIGIVAPIIVVLGRLLQGFSAGVELGGVSVYLAEIATPGHKGFYCAWQSASQQLAVITAASLGVALSLILPPETMSVWGWRIPFLLGCPIISFLFLMLRSTMRTLLFYFITAYTPTFGEKVLLLTNRQSLFVTFCVGLSNFIWLPIGGAISDNIGRRTLLVFFNF